MLRTMLFLLVAVLSLVFSSCLTIEQNITVNQDGSGVKTLTMDMGALFDNPMMIAAMESDETRNELQYQDSSFVLIDDMRDMNQQWSAEDIALLERATGRLQIDIDQELMLMTFNLPFNSFDELVRMERLMAEAKRYDEDDLNMGPGDADMLGMALNFGSSLSSSDRGISYELRKGQLTVTTPPADGDASEWMGFGEDTEVETEEIVKGMLQDMVMITSYTLPGKVTKVTGLKDAVTDGNSVFQEVPYEVWSSKPKEYMSGGKVTIKYKK